MPRQCPGSQLPTCITVFQAVGLPIGPLASRLDFVLSKTKSGEVLEITAGKIWSISAAGTVQMGELGPLQSESASRIFVR